MMSWGDVDWGDVPTAGGMLFAGAAAWYARQTMRGQQKQIAEQRAFITEQAANLRLEREELKAAAEERKQAQAQKVHMEASRKRNYETRTLRHGAYPPNQASAEVYNYSREPIQDVSAVFGRAQLPQTALVRGQSGEEDVSYTLRIPVLGPGRRCVFVTPVLSPGALRSERPVVFFTDATKCVGAWTSIATFVRPPTRTRPAPAEFTRGPVLGPQGIACRVLPPLSEDARVLAVP